MSPSDRSDRSDQSDWSEGGGGVVLRKQRLEHGGGAAWQRLAAGAAKPIGPIGPIGPIRPTAAPLIFNLKNFTLRHVARRIACRGEVIRYPARGCRCA